MGKRGAIGIDIGGTKTLLALVNDRYQIIEQVKFQTEPAGGRPAYSKRLVASVKTLVVAARKSGLKLVGVGVASAGNVDRDSCTIVVSPNILHLEGFPIGRILKRAIHLETVIGNDVELALYCEHQLGAAKGCENVLGVFFGTGVGGAAIINGKPFYGACGHGGQVGATLAHSSGGADTLESHGTLNHIASKNAIAGAALGMGIKQWAPHLYKEVGTDLAKVTWGALSRARKAGDKHIDDLVRSHLRVAGIALSSIVNFINPDMLVLGGGLTEEMPRLVVPSIESGLRQYLVPEVRKSLQIKAAKFSNKAGALGAARLALKKLG